MHFWYLPCRKGTWFSSDNHPSSDRVGFWAELLGEVEPSLCWSGSCSGGSGRQPLAQQLPGQGQRSSSPFGHGPEMLSDVPGNTEVRWASSLCPSSSHVDPPFPSFSHNIIPITCRGLFPCLHLHGCISQEDLSFPQASPWHTLSAGPDPGITQGTWWRISLRWHILNIKRTSDFHPGRILGNICRSRCYRYYAKQRGTEFQIRLIYFMCVLKD